MKRIPLAIALMIICAPLELCAFTCARVYNVIGVVGDSMRMGDNARVTIERMHTYDLDEVGAAEGGAISIDSYMAIAKRYAAGGMSLPKKVVASGGDHPEKITMSIEAFDALDPKPGEIIMDGPPTFAGCRFAVIALFSPDGAIRVAVNDGPRGEYRIGKEGVGARMGTPVKCTESTCSARAQVFVGKKECKLKEGEACASDGAISSVELLEARYPRGMREAPGGGWYLKYAMKFKNP